MERRNHCRTEVYGILCVLFPVDTSNPVDKLKKVENSLKIERFEVFSESEGAQPTRSVMNGELECSSVGLVRLSRRAARGQFRGKPSLSPAGSLNPATLVALAYLPAPTNEIPIDRSRLRPTISLRRDPVDVGQFGQTVARAPLLSESSEPPFGRFETHSTCMGKRMRPFEFYTFPIGGPGAAQALQSDSRTCRGVQGGSNTGRDGCMISQELAGQQRDEEMTR